MPFRFTFSLSDNDIFAVDALIILFGVIGIYLLLNTRFTSIYSFIGSMLFITYPVIIKWSAGGYTDVMSMTFLIWTIYFLILTRNNNSWFFIPSFIMFLGAIFTRYNSLLAIIPIIIIIFSKEKFLGDLKQFFAGIGVLLIALLPFFIFYTKIFGDPFFPFAAAFTQIEHLREAVSTPFQDALWYIKTLYINYLSPQNKIASYSFIISLITGLLIFVYRVIKENKFSFKRYSVFAGIIIIYLIIFNHAGLILRQIVLLALTLSFYSLVRKKDYAWLDSAFFGWFISYLDYNSHVMFRLERYQIPMSIPLVYLTIVTLSTISTAYSSLNIKSIRFVVKLIVYLIALSTALTSYNFGFNQVSKTEDKVVVDIKKASTWLSDKENNIEKKTVHSDVWPAVSWYMKIKVDPVPVYKNNKSYEHELLENNVDYLLTIRNRKYLYYKLIKKIGQISIYAKNNNIKIPYKPKVLFLGQKWNRYIDEVLNYKYYVKDEIDYATGNYAFGKSLYVDNYTVEELKKYPAILVYDFKWKDRLKTEKIIINYLSSGGNIIIDASGNVSTYHYNLNNTSFINMLIERKQIGTNSIINFKDDINDGLKENIEFESDGIWSGMSYRPINPNIKVNTLAKAGNSPLIIKQKVGKGNIYWIGYNFVWHAYLNKNKNERRLIENVLDSAYRSSLLLKK